jgi:hypothetical protein
LFGILDTSITRITQRSAAMSERDAEISRLNRRLDNLEEATLRGAVLLTGPDAETFAKACADAGLTVRAAQSDGKSDDIVRRRRIVARFLRNQQEWTIARIARALNKTDRGVGRML